MVVNPVMFSPGRARLSTRGPHIGSDPLYKNDRDHLGSVLGSYRSRSRGREEHVNFEMDKLINQGGEPVELTLRVSILESYILVLDIAEFAKLSQKYLT